jgi:hypothetical protein
MRVRDCVKASWLVVSVSLSCGTAFAADTLISKANSTNRAVDGINYKIEAYGGSLNGDGTGGVAGAVTIPLGNRFGVQFDVLAGSLQSDFVAGGAAHLFWRDPARGMIGIYASYTHWNVFTGLNASHIAAEGELYIGRFTFQAIAGVEDGSSTSAVAGPLLISYNVDQRFFDAINLHYYVQDNWRLTLGHRYMGGLHAAAFGTEFAFEAGKQMMSAFFEARVGENDFRGIYGGLKMYFGQRAKPLIKRHRQDDPEIWLPTTQSTMTNSKTVTMRSLLQGPVTFQQCMDVGGTISTNASFDYVCRQGGAEVPITDPQNVPI